MASIIFYLVAIVTANVITAAFQPLQVMGLIIPPGTLIIGLTFILRDFVQRSYGRNKTYSVIVLALILSAITSALLGDTMAIVAASALSFALSETADTEIYTRLQGSFSQRVLYSGIVGGILDSTVFVIIGLSPIGAGFLPWAAVPMAIAGQILAKVVMQGLGALVIKTNFEKQVGL
ncbi:VUT family protein [Aneurinibacillus tyrosinisolvens]|uniref:VUT family protein n=1 Tax=Aneurinibacillus tyrosinisolvens TaxID=1443435 RepID=UPI000A9730B8|nr:VUT family protein [Aneurinibacillus tyrosinisolvens]